MITAQISAFKPAAHAAFFSKFSLLADKFVSIRLLKKASATIKQANEIANYGITDKASASEWLNNGWHAFSDKINTADNAVKLASELCPNFRVEERKLLKQRIVAARQTGASKYRHAYNTSSANEIESNE
jgi:hypothetical protein